LHFQILLDKFGARFFIKWLSLVASDFFQNNAAMERYNCS